MYYLQSNKRHIFDYQWKNFSLAQKLFSLHYHELMHLYKLLFTEVPHKHCVYRDVLLSFHQLFSDNLTKA